MELPSKIVEWIRFTWGLGKYLKEKSTNFLIDKPPRTEEMH